MNLVRFLNATAGQRVDGDPVRVWLALLPQTEASSDRCLPPQDSALTAFNESALWPTEAGDPVRYDSAEGYAAWGTIAGMLSTQFPHLVALYVDDFTHVLPVGGYGNFTPSLVAAMTSNMRSSAPWMSFVPCIYYRSGHDSSYVFSQWPDLGNVVDSIAFSFRNEKGNEAAFSI